MPIPDFGISHTQTFTHFDDTDEAENADAYVDIEDLIDDVDSSYLPSINPSSDIIPLAETTRLGSLEGIGSFVTA